MTNDPRGGSTTSIRLLCGTAIDHSARRLCLTLFGVVGFGMIGANVGFELLVTFRLEVAHHFTEGCAVGRAGGVEPPVTSGAAKAAETLLLNPCQVPRHEG